MFLIVSGVFHDRCLTFENVVGKIPASFRIEEKTRFLVRTADGAYLVYGRENIGRKKPHLFFTRSFEKIFERLSPLRVTLEKAADGLDYHFRLKVEGEVCNGYLHFQPGEPLQSELDWSPDLETTYNEAHWILFTADQLRQRRLEFEQKTTLRILPYQPDMDHLLVVFRSNREEDVSWTRMVGVREHVLEPTGESHGRFASYLQFIVDRYDSLPLRVSFVKGAPFAHCPNLLEMLMPSSMAAFQDVQTLSAWCIEGERPPANVYEVARVGHKSSSFPAAVYKMDNTLDLVYWRGADEKVESLRRLGQEKFGCGGSEVLPRFWSEIGLAAKEQFFYPYVFEGQVSVARSNVLNHSKEVYEKMLGVVKSDPVFCESMMERIWFSLFDSRVYDFN